VPDERSIAAGQATLDFISQIKVDDLLICLISGGGSSLMATPREEISLEDIQLLTRSMLMNGASIGELNTIRCQLDQLKGGGLAGKTKGKILSLILSDVIGDDLTIIASGPTVPNQVAFKRLTEILEKYKIADLIPTSKFNIIKDKVQLDRPFLDRVQNIIVANNNFAIRSAKDIAVKEGFLTEIFDGNLLGEASVVGRKLAMTLRVSMEQKANPLCILSGGETTVRVLGNGKGGRNQELALAAVEVLDEIDHALLISLATDGNDGPTDAAGAVVDGKTNRRAKMLGLSASEYLSRNDSYSFFEKLGDLLKPGYSGTNVNDLIFLFGL
jgi:hydroxypyruvate reductase